MAGAGISRNVEVELLLSCRDVAWLQIGDGSRVELLAECLLNDRIEGATLLLGKAAKAVFKLLGNVDGHGEDCDRSE